jgi:hypothetical protein
MSFEIASLYIYILYSLTKNIRNTDKSLTNHDLERKN